MSEIIFIFFLILLMLFVVLLLLLFVGYIDHKIKMWVIEENIYKQKNHVPNVGGPMISPPPKTRK